MKVKANPHNMDSHYTSPNKYVRLKSNGQWKICQKKIN